MDIVDYKLQKVYVVIPVKDADKPYTAAIVSAKVVTLLCEEVESKFGSVLDCENISRIVECICSLYEPCEVSYRIDTRDVRYTFRPKMDGYRIVVDDEVKAAWDWSYNKFRREWHGK